MKTAAIAAAAAAHILGIDAQSIKDGLESFGGVKRRFDLQVKRPGCVYIDDYAHHPEEISAALSSIRNSYPDMKMTVVFQPHLYTRTRDFAPEFAEALSKADKLILLDIYPAREEPIPGVTSEIIFKDVTCPEKVLLKRAELMDYLKNEDVEMLVTLGAGDIDRFVGEIKEMLENRLLHFFGVSTTNATNEQYYRAIAMILRDMMTVGRGETVKKSDETGKKNVYYLSMEFLMGRSFKNTLFNLDLTDEMEKALSKFKVKLDSLYELEPDAGLGNGGLGRLAACFLDGLSSGSYPAMGYCIRYEYGIFRQKIVNFDTLQIRDYSL